MNQESAGARSSATPPLTTSDLPFSRIPHQSRLFLEYQNDATALKKYYPNAVRSVRGLSSVVPSVLASYKTDRDAICNALIATNNSAGSDAKALANIERLRDASTVAVVTGQQAGLLTGPLYTIYKALSAIKIAEDLTASGTQAVPIFWAATEDHDFDEVAKTFAIDNSASLFDTSYSPMQTTNDRMVGEITLDEGSVTLVDDLFDRMTATEFSAELSDKLKQFWKPAERFGDAFLKTLAWLFRDHGLILIDPIDKGIRNLSSDIFAKAIENADEIADRLLQRSEDLVADGYHAQVLIEPGYFPLFWIDDEGKRRALKKKKDVYQVKDAPIELTRNELLKTALQTPERLSPGVMLRPVVQDVLLPTACYVGGAAEIAYFAQNSEVYSILDRPVTPIMHRQSFTLIEPKQRRTMNKFGLKPTGLFEGVEKTAVRMSEEQFAADTAKLLDESGVVIEAELDRIGQHLSEIDPTVAANLTTRRRKIVYHIAALKRKALLARMRKGTDLERQIKNLFDTLLPNGELQERSLNVFTFLNKFGPGLIQWLYRTTDVECRDHRVVDL